MASQTKVFVATIVLQLVAEGRVGLDHRPADRAGHRHQHRPAAAAAPDPAARPAPHLVPEDTAALPPPRLHGYMPLDDRPPLVDGRLLPRRLLAEMLAPNDTGVPGWSYGLGLEEYTLPCGAVAVGHTGTLPGYSSGSFRLLGDDKGTGGGQPPPRPGCLVRGLLQRPGGAVLRHDPGSGSRPG